MKKAWRSILALALALPLGLGGCKTEDVTGTGETSAPEVPAVRTAAEAIESLGQEDYGLRNALSELTEQSTATVDGDSYFRLQQNYRGIPVYGRTVVYATDGEGHKTSVTGNPADVDPNLSLTPAVSVEQVRNGLRVYMAETLGLTGEMLRLEELPQDALCIYNMGESGRSHLAYCIQLGGYEFLVDAATGQVLTHSQTLFTNEYSGTESGSASYGYQDTDGSYVLWDPERNIYVYDAGGATYWNIQERKYYPEVLTLVRSDDAVFGNEDDNTRLTSEAVNFLDVMCQIHDYYADNFQDSGWGVMVLIMNDQLGKYKGDNAGGGILSVASDLPGTPPGYDSKKYQGIVATVIAGSSYNGRYVESIDVLGHEYTHVISRIIVQWRGGDQNGAINEGVSDLFGELIESAYNSSRQQRTIEPDWIHGDRNIIRPSQNGYPEKVTDRNWSREDDAHAYSTVISHAAYLMWNGIDGNEAKKLSTDELAELWYRAMLMMPSDCDFYGCRRLVELAATSMRLTQDQIDCVSEAFRMVGITSDSEEEFEADYKLNTNGTLSVYGGNDALYGNYTMVIGQKKPLGEIFGSGFRLTVPVTEAEPYVLDLSEGNYTLTLTDNANPERTVTFTLSIKDKHKEGNLNIFTDFGDISVKGTVSEIRRENGVQTNIPITNAVIRIQVSGEDTVLETIHMSDTEGFFETSLPEGDYDFYVAAEGYQGASYLFTLTPDRPAYLEMVLNRQVQKQLTYVVAYEEDLLYMETFLTYNDWGQIVAVREVWYTDGMLERERNESFFYDDKDRLIRVEDAHSDFGYVFVDEYVYDDQDRLTAVRIEEGGGWMKTEYEYDSSGQLVRTVEQADPYTLVTEYVYNSEGVLTATVLNYDQFGDTWTENCTYEYDSQGQVTRMEAVGPDGTAVEIYEYDYLGRQTRMTHQDTWVSVERLYDYGHKPFVIQTDGDGIINLSLDGWSIYLGNAQLQYSEDGTIVSAENEKYNSTYAFYYDGEMPEPAQDNGWKDLYIGYLEDLGVNITAVYHRYALAYVDEDDIPEIFLFSDSASPGTAIMWISDGEVHMTTEIGYGGAAYQEKQGVFTTEWLNRGIWVDTVYSLREGKLTTLHRGRKYSDGSIEWDNTAVTNAEYQELFSQAFDASTAITVEGKYPMGNLTADILAWK